MILVLGGTGSCGRFFVGQALNEGHSVRVITRDRNRINTSNYPWAEHPNLEVIEGNGEHPELLLSACLGIRSVVSFVGPKRGSEYSSLPEVIRNTVAGMRAHGVRRLIVQTGGFVKLSGESVGFTDKAIKHTFALAMKEKATLKGNDEVALFLEKECNDIDWTITRPGLLSDEMSKGSVVAAFDYGPGTPPQTITKEDLTWWTLSLLEDAQSIHRAPTMQYTKIDYDFATQKVNGRKKVAVITGANSGLGFETARVLLLKGMQVVCACRNLEKGTEAIKRLRELTAKRPSAQDNDIRLMELDVSNLNSVRTFAESYQQSGLPIHVLLCNAGIMMGPPRRSVDDIDLQVATNYLGHFLLCNELLDCLKSSAPARIVHVSSIAARMGTIDLNNLNPSPENYNSMRVYQMTKLMTVVFSRELNSRLEGTGVTSNSLEPGVVATNLSKGITDDPAMRKKLEQGLSVEDGALTQIFLCSSQQVNGKGGGNYERCKDISVGVDKFRYILAAHSLRQSLGAQLWDESEKLIQQRVTF